MPLHPQSEAHLKHLKQVALPHPWEIGAPETRRRALAALDGVPAGPALPRVEDRAVPGPAGDIPVRIYWPSEDVGLPVLMWFHGGGWVLGSIEASDPVCRRLAEQSGAIVISVDYRLAPEHVAPAALDDCFATTVWAAEQAEALGADASRIAVSGPSAGGNLAAAVALYARDHHGPKLVHQLLVFPVIDSRMDSESDKVHAKGLGLTQVRMTWFWDQYVPEGGAVSRDDPRVSPAHASDLAGLPRAHLIMAEYDPLCDEGEAYAARLEAAGVPTRCDRVDGHLHAFFSNPHIFDAATVSISEAAKELRASFAAVGASA